jgi:hypothetical protein
MSLAANMKQSEVGKLKGLGGIYVLFCDPLTSRQSLGSQIALVLILQVSEELKTNRPAPAEYKQILEAIKEAEIARREDEDARHVSLLQELRRQHFEKMAVLNQIRDALNNRSSE